MIIVVDDSKSQPLPIQVPTQDGSDAAAAPSPNGHLGPVRPRSSESTRTSYAIAYHTSPHLPPPRLTPPSPPPPSYPKYPGHPHRPAAQVPAPVVGYRLNRSPAQRFCKAFAVAVLLYVLLFSLAHAIVDMANHGRHWHNRDDSDGSVGVPRAQDGRVLESIGGLDWRSYHARPGWAPTFPHGAETSFVLPVASDELYFVSQGAYQNGKVQVTQSSHGGGDVRVDVRVAYHDERALARATVCRLHKSGNRNGVGIYTPTPAWSDLRDRLYFDVVWTLPAAPSDGVPLRINEFTTDTSNFVQEMGDLWRSVLFDNVQLTTSNSRIQVDAITLTRGSVTSSNGPIIGHFNTSDALTLHTSNAPIQATASLFSTGGGSTTQLEMRTSNSPITSSVSLISESGSRGDFIVNARSSNGAITLRYDDAPLNARLVSDARTSNSPASVVMHPAFEGTYEVSTSNSRPVVRDMRPVDPSGAGRRRVVEQNQSRNVVSGRVYWGGRRGEGASTVHSSNARASLDL